MHRLEYMLVVLAERIRQDGNTKMANETLVLATAAANFQPTVLGNGENADDHFLDAMHQSWYRRYNKLLHKRKAA